MGETRTVFEMGLREYARSPVLLALLVFLPAYFVLVFDRVVPEQPVTIDVPVQGAMQAGMTTVVTVLMTPMAAAFVGGAAGLFLMQSASEVDGRLRVVGAATGEILVARLGVLALAAGVGSFVSVGVLSVVHPPERIWWYLSAVFLVGLLYGGLGALVGLVLNRLGGIYVLMFGPLLDIFLAQSPLSEETTVVAPYLPAHYPMKLAFDAAFTARVDLQNLWWAGVYLGVVGLVVALAFGRTLRLQ